jgi:hypothetical protein
MLQLNLKIVEQDLRKYKHVASDTALQNTYGMHIKILRHFCMKYNNIQSNIY